MAAFLSNKKCVDCGEKDPRVLDFDHINPSRKRRPIAKMLSGHNSWRSILLEIKKCKIRCANCHRRKSYNQFLNLGKKSTSS